MHACGGNKPLMKIIKRLSMAMWLGAAACGFAPAEEGSVTPVSPLQQEQPEQTLPVLPVKPLERVRALPSEVTTVLKDETNTINLLLNENTVFCSVIGYGASFLKVSIPQLDVLAFFDHRVEEAGLPCAAVGACNLDLGPDQILQGSPGTEQVQVRIVLTELLTLDHAKKTCTRQLLEDVSAVVRGVQLKHHEEDRPSPMAYEMCLVAAQR